MRGHQSSYVIPSFLSSTYQQPPTTTHHPSNQVFKQSIHFPPMTQYNLHTRKWSRSRFPFPPFLLFFAFVALCFSILSPFVQRLSIIFGCSVRALGNPCITSQRSPCDKYNAPLSFFIPMRILAFSVSLPPFVTEERETEGMVV